MARRRWRLLAGSVGWAVCGVVHRERTAHGGEVFESFQASSEALALQYNKSFRQLDPREFFTEYAMWEKLAVDVHENDRSGKPLAMSTAIGYMRSLLQQALRICDGRTDIEQEERSRYKDFFSCIDKLSVTTSGLWPKGVFSSMMKQSVRRGAEEGIEMNPKTPPLYPMRHTANIVRAYYTLGDRQV